MTEQHNPETQTRFLLHRMYIKKLYFDARKSHEVLQAKWTPEISMELKVTNTAIEEPNLYEVDLHINLTMQSNKRLAYILELTQSGIFEIANFGDKQKEQLLNAYCATTLYPFLRGEVAHIVTQAGFPQLLLAPINFDAIYAQQLTEKAKKDTEEATKAIEKGSLLVN